MIPHLAAWQWSLGVLSAFMVGVGKTGAPGVATIIVPLMVISVGDARAAAAWTVPILSTADVFAVWYWRRSAEAKTLFKLIPWVVVGMAGGAAALSLSEPIIRKIVASIVLAMLIIGLWRRWRKTNVEGHSAAYGITAACIDGRHRGRPGDESLSS